MGISDYPDPMTVAAALQPGRRLNLRQLQEFLVGFTCQA